MIFKMTSDQNIYSFLMRHGRSSEDQVHLFFTPDFYYASAVLLFQWVTSYKAFTLIMGLS